MRNYEIMFIIKPNLEEGSIKKSVTALEKVITSNNAKITNSKNIGQKEFAYEIKKFKTGYYFLYNIETNDDKVINEFDRIAKIDENVIRHMIIKVER